MKEFQGQTTVDGGAPGELQAGYHALGAGCAFSPSPPADRLEATGEDRHRFLHGQTTCEVKALEPGAGAYGFLLDPKGRVLADAVITDRDDRLAIDLPAGRGAEMLDRLERYIVADRVEISCSAAPPGLLVAGPNAAEALESLFEAAPPTGWDCHAGVWEGSPMVIGAERRLGVPAWRFEASPDRLNAIAETLAASGAVEASWPELEAIRIERGVPRAGIDFGAGSDAGRFPQETGLEDWAVSYTKGCYTGQEVVARIHYRGRVNHQLRGLAGPPGASGISPGELVDEAGEAAGRLSSSSWSPALGRSVGLAILHRKVAAAGTRLRTSTTDHELEIVELPFVASPPGDS